MYVFGFVSKSSNLENSVLKLTRGMKKSKRKSKKTSMWYLEKKCIMYFTWLSLVQTQIAWVYPIVPSYSVSYLDVLRLAIHIKVKDRYTRTHISIRIPRVSCTPIYTHMYITYIENAHMGTKGYIHTCSLPVDSHARSNSSYDGKGRSYLEPVTTCFS